MTSTEDDDDDGLWIDSAAVVVDLLKYRAGFQKKKRHTWRTTKFLKAATWQNS